MASRKKASRKTARKAARKPRLSEKGRRAISKAARLRWRIYRAERALEQRRLAAPARKRKAVATRRPAKRAAR